MSPAREQSPGQSTLVVGEVRFASVAALADISEPRLKAMAPYRVSLKAMFRMADWSTRKLRSLAILDSAWSMTALWPNVRIAIK